MLETEEIDWNEDIDSDNDNDNDVAEAAEEQEEEDPASAAEMRAWADAEAEDALYATVQQRRRGARPPALVLNKVDLVSYKPELLPLADQLVERGRFGEVFMVSALEHDGTDRIMEHLLDVAPYRPWMFQKDDVCVVIMFVMLLWLLCRMFLCRYCVCFHSLNEPRCR